MITGFICVDSDLNVKTLGESADTFNLFGITHYFDRYIGKAGLKGRVTQFILSVTPQQHISWSPAQTSCMFQELLGHEKPDTTAKYAHLMLDSLRKVYKTFHPRENEFYKEVDSEYLSKVMFLKEKILKSRRRHKK